MILVVGATGELGTAIVQELVDDGHRVRAFVRPASAYGHLVGPNVEFAYGDLRDPMSVDRAVDGVETVVATANAVAPRDGSTFEMVDDLGYRTLIEAAERHRVDRFIYISTPETPLDDEVPSFTYKRMNERRLRESRLTHTIVRPSLFMDSWLALIGSSIPTRGAEQSLMNRPFWFTRAFRRLTGRLVERRGRALVPGDGSTRHAFVSIDDVATFVAVCVGNPVAENATVHVGGPESLSWNEVVDVYSEVLGRPVRPVYTPVRVYTALQRLATPISPAAANIFGMERIVASADTGGDVEVMAEIGYVPQTTVKTFLGARVDPAERTSPGHRIRVEDAA
ncbi:SDR family oxidoreductase [Haloprofundus salilacus]|uniref:SDR family oxidoreductase n=1 Tax=Haloprofundus salilacus TaxID=2876190 RepID=UPI001CCA897D|nr:SDR family oxidoreductase [Haloprofundus salilacus]